MVEGTDEFFAQARREMLEQIALHTHSLAGQIGRRRLADKVMRVMDSVPRHEFVHPSVQPLAYLDQPLPIGYDKTISQPFIVALMTDLLDVQPRDVVLDIGTGLGYQAAVLSRLSARIYSVEIIPELAKGAMIRLLHDGCENVEVRIGDGSRGWAEHAPFDRIIAAAAPQVIPPALLNQLKPGGRMVLPVGLEDLQALMLIEKTTDGAITTQEVLPVRFSALVVPH